MTTSKYTMNAEGLFVCPHCGETKARKNTMFYHIKKHVGALDYPCPEPGCGKAYVQKSAMDQHRLQAHPAVAAAERRYWGCPCCDLVSHVKANVVIHIGRMHGDPWIPATGAVSGECPGCHKAMASPTAYFYHAMACFAVPLDPVPVASSAEPKAMTLETSEKVSE